MSIRKSPFLIAMENKYIGKKVSYFLFDITDKKSNGSKLIGPFAGTVEGLGTNEGDIENCLEGLNYRNSVQFSGFLFIKPEKNERAIEEVPHFLVEIKETDE